MKKSILIGVVSVLFAGCVSAGEVEDDGRLQVVATVGMAADMVESIGGDFVNVEGLMGPGVDPHLYQPSAGDVARLENAELAVYVGLHLEGKMMEIFEALEEDKAVVALGDEVSVSELLGNEDGNYAYDPHIWFDVGLWSEAVMPLAEKLVEVDPANGEFYMQNAELYLADLVELDRWVEGRVAEVPEESRVLITAHDAFGYFGEAYGFEVRGLQGISTSSDFGLKDLEELVDFIVEREVKAIFVESSVSKKSIEALQAGVEGKGWSVEIGGELYSDAMGEEGTDAGTYLGMVRHNVNVIVDSLL